MAGTMSKEDSLLLYWPLITEQAKQLLRKAGRDILIACEDKSAEEEWKESDKRKRRGKSSDQL